MKKKAKYPYGVSNFEQLVKEDFILIDKTSYIELLEEDASPFVSYLRPRKIGKSLFLSILEYYYDIKRKEKFEALFGNTYIGQNPTPKASSFRILKFDFSGIDTQSQEKVESNFLKNISESVNKFIIKYNIFDSEILKHIITQNTPANLIRSFFEAYQNLENNPLIYLLIDEYDHFTNEILWRDLEEFRGSVSQDGYIRKFYENIKIATQSGIINRFFITGVSPMTLDSLTSGFNIVKHLTHSVLFHNMMGFTEEEVATLLDLCLEDENRRETILQDLRNWYNGYKFNLKTKNTVYNSNMTLYFLDEFKNSQEYPMLMLDPNIMPDYGKLKKMFEVANFEENIEVLEEVLEKKEILSEQIYQFDFSKPFGEISFINFLYYLGNLTIKSEGFGGNGVIFKIPNQVISELYWQYYAFVLQQKAQLRY